MGGGVDHVKVLNYIAKKDNIRVNKYHYPVKVHKIAYFAECFCIKTYDKQLIDKEPMSWDRGPVYKVSRDNQDKSCVLPSCVTNLLDEVIKLFSEFSGDELSNLSHITLPWQLYKKKDKDCYSKPISKKSMFVYSKSDAFAKLIEYLKNKNKNN